MEPIYRIRLLGSIQIEKQGTALPAFRTQKALALLGYLIRQQQPVSRSYLADLLWGDHSETRARRNLSNELSHLSAHLPGLLEADRQTIQFRPGENYWVDTVAFERLVEVSKGDFSATPQQAKAVVLYRSDFMARLTLDDCPEFEMWLQSEQEYWRRRVGEMLERLVEHHADLREDGKAQAYARRWLAMEPWCEEAHRYLMLLLARSGQRSAALAQFESCRRILAEELAVAPAAETLALVEQIRRGGLTVTDRIWEMDAKRRESPLFADLDPQFAPAPLLSGPSAPGPTSPDRRHQLVLLNKVKQFWVKGVLEQTLRDIPRLELVRQSSLEGIEQPWAQVVEPLPHDTQPIPPEKSMLDLFQEADCALLILGSPGVGKTITLIELARELIALAEAGSDQPIPVILNLSSWSKRHNTLADWVVEELVAKYQIPCRMGRTWLENNELLLLLDGFDEIAVKHQPDGVRAINQFRETHGLTGMVVCSRTDVFEGQPSRLRLGRAVLLQPLNIAQIDHFLAAGGSLNFLRVALQWETEHGGTELHEILESPLMLSIIRLAYQGIGALTENATAGLVFPAGPTEDTRRHLFAAYVQRMLQRRGGKGPYTTSQTEAWLTWLAQKMLQHDQTIFRLEELQPSWLPTRAWRWIFLLSYRTIETLPIAVTGWAYILFYQTQAPEIASKAVDLVTELLPFSDGWGVFLGTILIALGLSGIVAVFDGFYFEWLDRRADSAQPVPFQIGRHFVVAGLAGGLPAIMIFLASPDSLWVALYCGVLSGGGYGLLSYLVHGQGFNETIRTVEKVSWSWVGALKGALLGLIFGIVLQIVGWQLTADFARGIEILWGIGFLIVGAARGQSLERKNTPNQGIKLSAKNSLLAGFLAGVAGGLFGWLSVDGYNGLRFGLAWLVTWWLFYGGGNVINHFLLRLLLWANGNIPWNYTRFLDLAAERILLRKVGGGYIFMHRLLQAYFANLVEYHHAADKLKKLRLRYSPGTK